jgi:hypothetical protein
LTFEKPSWAVCLGGGDCGDDLVPAIAILVFAVAAQVSIAVPIVDSFASGLSGGMPSTRGEKIMKGLWSVLGLLLFGMSSQAVAVGSFQGAIWTL